MTKRIPAEWEPHEFTQITWPSVNTDWADNLEAVTRCYVGIAKAVASYEPLLVITDSPDVVREALSDVRTKHPIRIVECPINDTWARDHAFITSVDEEGHPSLIDFQFNGWGLKFASCFDNQINAHLHGSVLKDNAYASALKIVLEGGSIESDGKGTILTTLHCLLAPNRNCYETKAEADAALRPLLGHDLLLWVDHGCLAGDDTDGHVDTLARLAPDNTILYVACEDQTDEHYAELKAMEEDLKALRTQEGKPFRLVALPMATPNYDPETGERLPATYANFYFVNGAVLLPVYNIPTDAAAIEVMQQTFADRKVVAVPCAELIRQHGSLHCATMQYPRGVKLSD